MKGAKATRGTRHEDHQERQPRAIRNRVHGMQRFTDCTETLVARRGAGSLSFLVLRKLRSRLVGECDQFSWYRCRPLNVAVAWSGEDAREPVRAENQILQYW